MLTCHITIIPPFQIGLRAWQCVTVPHETRLCENPVDNQSVHAAKDNPVRCGVRSAWSPWWRQGGRDLYAPLFTLSTAGRLGSTAYWQAKAKIRAPLRSLFWFYFTVPKFMMCFTFEATRRVAVSLYKQAEENRGNKSICEYICAKSESFLLLAPPIHPSTVRNDNDNEWMAYNNSQLSISLALWCSHAVGPGLMMTRWDDAMHCIFFLIQSSATGVARCGVWITTELRNAGNGRHTRAELVPLAAECTTRYSYRCRHCHYQLPCRTEPRVEAHAAAGQRYGTSYNWDYHALQDTNDNSK